MKKNFIKERSKDFNSIKEKFGSNHVSNSAKKIEKYCENEDRGLATNEARRILLQDGIDIDNLELDNLEGIIELHQARELSRYNLMKEDHKIALSLQEEPTSELVLQSEGNTLAKIDLDFFEGLGLSPEEIQEQIEMYTQIQKNTYRM